MNALLPPFRLRSYERREGRKTQGQERAYQRYWPQWGLTLADKEIIFNHLLKSKLPISILEIGFGTGQSLLALAKANPDQHFIGIETYRAGIGALFLGMERQQVNNIRVFENDAVDVLAQCMPAGSLDVVQIFFPDPWPKRRQHPRRLIQPAFVEQIASVLKTNGQLHLATDWEDYAVYMMKVMSQCKAFNNLAGMGQYSARSAQRPLLTKFEQRAIREGRKIWDLCFAT